MSEEIKKVTGCIGLSVNAECPHCEAYIDLMEIKELTAEGDLQSRVFGERFGCKDLDMEVECPDCGKDFAVGEIEY